MPPSLSIWERDTFFSNIDVVIIGAGIVGLNAAIALKKASPNLHVAVFERGTLPTGASTKNAGFACFGSMTELLDDLDQSDENEVFGLVEKRLRGLLRLRQLLGDEAMKFQKLGGYEVFRSQETEIFQKCADRIQPFNLILKAITGEKSVFSVADSKISPFGFGGVEHLIYNAAEGQIDTGKMMKNLVALARNLGIEIFNGLEITRLEEEGNGVFLENGNGWPVRAKKAIVATNGFAAQLTAGLELMPARNQVLVTEAIPSLPFKGCFHLDRGYFYFRSIESRQLPGRHHILLGGGRNLSPQKETTVKFGQTPLIQNQLEQLLETVIFPEKKLKIDMRWSGILGIGPNKRPIIKELSPSVVVSVRLGGMGVAVGALVGEQAANIVLEKLG